MKEGARSTSAKGGVPTVPEPTGTVGLAALVCSLHLNQNDNRDDDDSEHCGANAGQIHGCACFDVRE